MAAFTTALAIGSGAALAGGAGMGILGANKEADAAAEAAKINTQMQLQSLKQQQEAQEYARKTMAPYTGYGLMGMERMLGTAPMQQTMGGNAQTLIRQQQPTLTERTDRYLGEDFTQEMVGNLLGEEGKVSVKDWLTGKRTSLDQKDAEKHLLAKALSMLRGHPTGENKERPWEQWEYEPSVNLPKYGEGGGKFSPGTALMGGYNMLQKRQFGGPVRSSQPYLVGEAGPEVIVPQQAGTVIPNVQGNLLAGGGMGQRGVPMQPGMPQQGMPGGRPMQIAQAIAAAGGQGRPGQIANAMLNYRPQTPTPGGTMQQGVPAMQGGTPQAGMPGGRPMQMAQAIAAAGGGGRMGNLARFISGFGQPQRSIQGAPMQQGVQARQFGGPVTGGNPYLVGETGPEVVMPQRTKADIKKDMMRKALGLKPLGQTTQNPMQPVQPSPTMYQGGQNLLGDAPLTNYGQINPPSLPGTGGPNTGLYMLDPATQSLMDWETMVNTPDTPVQKGILEQGPPDAGTAPVRQDFDFAAMQNSPWYQQPLQQGIDAIERSAIGQGGLYSGNTMQALNQFGQDYAFSKYMPARQQALGESESDFNRWLQSGQFGLNQWLQGTLQPTQEMIRVGQNSALGQANNALNSAQQNANILSNIGNSQASGALGTGAAYSGLYNNFGNLLNQGAGMGINYLMG